MLEARKYLGFVGIGVTKPLLIEADDGEKYIVKLQNNRLGAKVLVNEYIASRFAEKMDLCFPKGLLISLSSDFINGSMRLKKMRVKAGIHFASLYIKNAKYVHRYHVDFIKDKHKIAGVMLFDHLTHNADRTLNSRNMLIERETDGYKFYAIDNSHLFGSGRWRKESLSSLIDGVRINDRRLYGTLLRHYLCKEDFIPYIEQFKAITAAEIEKIIAAIPAEWLKEEAERLCLQEFFIRRLQNIEAIADRIVLAIEKRKANARKINKK